MNIATLPFSFLKEDDYTAVMESGCAAWLKESVKTAQVESTDGTMLRVYYGIPEGATVCIVMVHGFCEFFGKYHEMAWYFYRAGYAFCFPEQRGHGYSGGKMPEPDVVHVDHFNIYVNDLCAVLDRVVRDNCKNMKRVLFAHSMGGAVSALFLEKYPDFFSQALLSSPMFAWKKLKLGPVATTAISLYAGLTHKTKKLAPAERHFDEMEAFETSSMQSKARYDYSFHMRICDVHNRSYGASYGWAVSSLNAMRRLMKNAEKITLPVTIFASGNDGLVDVKIYEDFRAKVPQTNILRYETAKHEVYNALDEERIRFYQDLFRLLPEA